MKYKKQCKRLLALMLCATVFIQSFFSGGIQTFAGMDDTQLLESYTYDSATNFELESVESAENINKTISVDNTGQELVPAYDFITVNDLNEPYDNLNPVIDLNHSPNTRSFSAAVLSMFWGAVTIGLSIGLVCVSHKFCESLSNYFRSYAYPEHIYEFKNVKFSYTDADGYIVETTITQQMMENLGKKLEAYEAGRIWETIFILTEEDKLCLTYVMYKNGALTTISRDSINIKKPISEIADEYPYYIMSAFGSSVYQICFNKKPIGAIKNSYSSSNRGYYLRLFDYTGNEVKFAPDDTIFFSDYKINYNNGTSKLLIDFCDFVTIPYNFNSTSGLWESSQNVSTWKPTITDTEITYYGPANLGESFFPFHFYNSSATSNYNASNFLLNALESPEFGSYVNTSTFYVSNYPHCVNILDYLNALPNNLSIREEFDINSPLNLDETSSYLNPTGVRTWAGAIDPPRPPDTGDVDIDIDPIMIGLDDIARQYGTFKCKEAADAMAEYLDLQKKNYKFITMKYPRPVYILSLSREMKYGDYQKAIISTNGMHYGIEYNGFVYCNIHPYGLPRKLWENDFWGDWQEDRTITPP